MNSDRELLELSAKAASLDWDMQTTEKDYKWGLWLTMHGEPYEGQRRSWNPLRDDSDALRLAVKLKIDTQHYPDHVVCWYEDFFGTGKIFYNDNPCAATRRAIVRAASAIGETK